VLTPLFLLPPKEFFFMHPNKKTQKKVANSFCSERLTVKEEYELFSDRIYSASEN
jgi:hypothetical protein